MGLDRGYETNEITRRLGLDSPKEWLDFMTELFTGEPEEYLETDFKDKASAFFAGGFWCGTNGDLLQAKEGWYKCPGDYDEDALTRREWSKMWIYSENADWACFRHDHSTKLEHHDNRDRGELIAYDNVACSADYDLQSQTDTIGVQAIYGQLGLSAFWGCYDKKQIRSWGWECRGKGWWKVCWPVYRYEGEVKEHVVTGYNRYDFKYRYGYRHEDMFDYCGEKETASPPDWIKKEWNNPTVAGFTS